MAERSKLDGPAETVRPSVGVGAPGGGATGPGGGARPSPFGPGGGIDIGRTVKTEMIRRLAKDTAYRLLADVAESIRRTMGMEVADVGEVLLAVAGEYQPMDVSITPAPAG